jgi:pimeloyl-ACP methyl ester carboxylesterase
MATYVLVHGGWVGAWIWEPVVPLLDAAGHRAVAIDLPGHGADPTPPAQVTLESHVEAVGRVLAGELEPAVLVGHSSGGVVITQAAEAYAERIRALVYVCAYLPRDGEALLQLAQTESDPARSILPHIVFREAEGVATLSPGGAREAVFTDLPADEATRIVERLEPEPMAFAMTPVRTTPERFGRISRVYVACARDRVISPTLQERMYTATPCRVVMMDTGHSPFLARPEEFVAHLTAL